jgi:hypothetical protein
MWHTPPAVAARSPASGSMDSDHIAMTETLSYAGFVEALGRIALIALDKPAFERLYPSAVDKVWVRGPLPHPPVCFIDLSPSSLWGVARGPAY